MIAITPSLNSSAGSSAFVDVSVGGRNWERRAADSAPLQYCALVFGANCKSGSGVSPLDQSEEPGRLFHFKPSKATRIPFRVRGKNARKIFHVRADERGDDMKSSSPGCWHLPARSVSHRRNSHRPRPPATGRATAGQTDGDSARRQRSDPPRVERHEKHRLENRLPGGAPRVRSSGARASTSQRSQATDGKRRSAFEYPKLVRHLICVDRRSGKIRWKADLQRSSATNMMSNFLFFTVMPAARQLPTKRSLCVPRTGRDLRLRPRGETTMGFSRKIGNRDIRGVPPRRDPVRKTADRARRSRQRSADRARQANRARSLAGGNGQRRFVEHSARGSGRREARTRLSSLGRRPVWRK